MDAVSTPNLETIARCLTTQADQRPYQLKDYCHERDKTLSLNLATSLDALAETVSAPFIDPVLKFPQITLVFCISNLTIRARGGFNWQKNYERRVFLLI